MGNRLSTSLNHSIRTPSSRAVVYGTLAKALGPNAASLAGAAFVQDLSKAIKALPDFNLEQELVAVREALTENALNSEALAIEHTRLFARGLCSPYETSYDVKRKAVKTHDLADVAGFYAAFGIKPQGELPDHIVSELEFMSLLCLKEVYALSHGKQAEAEICVEAQHKFVQEHLGRWLSLFSERVREKARLRIYPVVVDLMQRFVVLDASHLESL